MAGCIRGIRWARSSADDPYGETFLAKSINLMLDREVWIRDAILAGAPHFLDRFYDGYARLLAPNPYYFQLVIPDPDLARLIMLDRGVVAVSML